MDSSPDRPKFTLRWMLTVVLLAAVVFAAIAVFRRSNFVLPPNAAQVLVDCGSRRLDFMWIVVVDGDRHLSLSPYAYKVTYTKSEGGGLLMRYGGAPLGSESDIFVEWMHASEYLFLAQDEAQKFHVWRLDDTMLTIEEPRFGRTIVTISIADGIASESPSQELLEELNLLQESDTSSL